MWSETIDYKPSRAFENTARLMLSLFIVAILVAIFAGTGRTFFDLRLIVVSDFHCAFKVILVDMLSVLALVEVLRTALAYFTEGRLNLPMAKAMGIPDAEHCRPFGVQVALGFSLSRLVPSPCQGL